MAVGDVVSGIASVAAGGTLDFQPAAGVEALIRGIGGSKITGTAPDQYLQAQLILYDGTNEAYILSNPKVGVTTPVINVFINNSRYIRVKDTSGVGGILSYWGVQTK